MRATESTCADADVRTRKRLNPEETTMNKAVTLSAAIFLVALTAPANAEPKTKCVAWAEEKGRTYVICSEWGIEAGTDKPKCMRETMVEEKGKTFCARYGEAKASAKAKASGEANASGEASKNN
jgi:hypothetical protein